MSEKEITLNKVYATHVVTPFSFIGVAFYETQNGRVLRLLYFNLIEKVPKSEYEEFAEAWFQITGLAQDTYSPPIIRGEILLESDERMLIKSGERVYHFEKSSKQEIEETEKYVKNRY